MNSVIKTQHFAHAFDSANDNCDGLLHIGRCVGCDTMDLLVNGACTDCIDTFGEKCGILFQKIRENAAFARVCYNKLKNEEAKRYFIEWFGPLISTG